MRRGIVCVFAKPPRPGQCKSRLAAAIGPGPAAGLAQAFLHDTWQCVAQLSWARPILATTDSAGGSLGLTGQPEIWPQGPGDLGQRMVRVLRRALGMSDFAMIVGADVPGLPVGHFEDAHDRLHRSEAVLGPADDGGFYLIGMTRCPDGLLDDLPWGQSTAFEKTHQRLIDAGLRVETGLPWFDVDRPEDLDRLRARIADGSVRAPATAHLLGQIEEQGR